MSELEQIQKDFIAALDGGPDQMPCELFTGSLERSILGMKVHANTVSHARLVALEDTFPRTRQHLGEAEFNELSRLFVEQPNVAAMPLAEIGREFPTFLAMAGSAGELIDLARFDWDWLSCHNAADSRPLSLADLAGMDETALAVIEIMAHPAARLVRSSARVRAALAQDMPELRPDDVILLVRPDAEVIGHRIGAVTADLLRSLTVSRAIGNLMASQLERDSRDCIVQDQKMPSLIELICAGALIRVA